MKFLLKYYTFWLATFALAKIAFILYNVPADAAPVAGDFWDVWRHGLPLDLATAGYLTALPWLLSLVGVFVKCKERLVERLYVSFSIALALVMAAILLGDTCLYSFWNMKLDATVWTYLSQPQGAVQSVTPAYLLAVVALYLLLSALLFGGQWMVFKKSRGERFLRRKWLHMAVHLLAGGLLFLGIRGGVGKSTANVGMAYYSQQQFFNHAAVNPAFSLLASTLKQHDFTHEARYFAPARCAEIYRTLGYNTESLLTDTLLTTSRPNVVIIILEGCGGVFVHAVDSLSSPAITPHLNALAREGVLFTQMMANSFRTDRGTVSILSGYPAYPTVSLMKLPAQVQKLPGIARTLRSAGYTTDFLYGGDINFTGTNGYLLATGYQRTFGDTSFPASQRRTHDWGVTDRYTFPRLLSMIKARESAPAPWHIGFLTLASHEPWKVPYERIKNDPVANSMAYLDDCLGRFIRDLKQTKAWKNTLVVVLPDHGIAYGDVQDMHHPRRSHVPMLWLGGAVKQPRVVNKLCNQSDLAATLLGQLHLPHDDFRFSRDILSATYTRPSAFHCWTDGALWRDTTGLTALNLLTRPSSVLSGASPQREAHAKAFLQTIYDALGK